MVQEKQRKHIIFNFIPDVSKLKKYDEIVIFQPKNFQSSVFSTYQPNKLIKISMCLYQTKLEKHL
jgi:hypothetical protein